jgi:hypothetical protein
MAPGGPRFNRASAGAIQNYFIRLALPTRREKPSNFRALTKLFEFL